MFLACVLEAFTDSFVEGNHHVWFLDVVPRVLLASAGFFFHWPWSSFFILLMAHAG